ncbi:hydroxyacid dehydrogenase [Paenibacillus sp. WQ 127069]|uniref:Hydroxyacid dehydrogenase n=1 Tax=Paenibacillus baimaensis TaxID=2982185 RepID=A0ABT2UNK8_9BACL|nr:hydroxyacid dehydrogenase [Paenibacillus sp. WQ 127069]MCU6796234.1 hydroxyacid dehydrogenase [Paenibacillus sp. WQ 127069]
MQKKAIFLAEQGNTMINRVFDGNVRDRLNQQVELQPVWIHPGNAKLHMEELAGVEIAFSTWGLPLFTVDELQVYLPNLKVLFYAAGSVQRFAREYMSRNCAVVSTWAANAVPVAEYTAAQIVLANKGYFQTVLHCKRNHVEAKQVAQLYPGNYAARVGILGAGMIGKKVIELLKPYNIQIDVFDPYLSDTAAADLGVRKTDLLDIFTNCDVISNHLANLPATVGMLNKQHFDKMQPHATFINTGRGAQLIEEDLIQALRDEPTRTAVLDVTHPEPVSRDSALLTLDNVILTPHIAGSMGNEVARMGHYAAGECERYLSGVPLQYQVTLSMLETMA